MSGNMHSSRHARAQWLGHLGRLCQLAGDDITADCQRAPGRWLLPIPTFYFKPPEGGRQNSRSWSPELLPPLSLCVFDLREPRDISRVLVPVKWPLSWDVELLGLFFSLGELGTAMLRGITAC